MQGATGVGPPQHAGSTEVQDNKCGLHIAYRHHFPPEIDEFIGRNFPRIAGHANLVCVRMINARHGMMLLVKAVISPMEQAFQGIDRDRFSDNFLIFQYIPEVRPLPLPTPPPVPRGIPPLRRQSYIPVIQRLWQQFCLSRRELPVSSSGTD